MKKRTIFIAIAIVVFLTGCANWNSVYRKKNLSDDVTVVSVDAKQRFLLSAAARNASGDYQHFRKLCAEPSPDVFSAFAAAFEGGAQTEAFEAALKGSFSENAASIGLRTQAIQLLRDGMYRICEGVLNKSIDKDDFLAMHQRYQRIMVTLVAIEQLTGAVTPPQIAIETSAYTGGPTRLPALQDELTKAREQLAETEEALATESDATYSVDADGDGETEDLKCSKFEGEIPDRPGDCSEYFAMVDDVKEKNESVASLEEQIDVAQDEIITKASGNVTVVHEMAKGSSLTDAAALKIAGTVKGMVDSVFNLDPDSAIQWFDELKCPIAITSQAITEQREALENYTQRLQPSVFSENHDWEEVISRGGQEFNPEGDRIVMRALQNVENNKVAKAAAARAAILSEVESLSEQEELLANIYFADFPEEKRPNSFAASAPADVCRALARSVNSSIRVAPTDEFRNSN